MTSLATFTDVEKPLRDWLQSKNITNVSGRVYVGLPQGVTFPAIELTMIDGGPDPMVPQANVAISYSVWGEKGSRVAASAAAWALASVLQSTDYAALSNGLLLRGTVISLGPTPRFDPDGTPRYVIEATHTLIST